MTPQELREEAHQWLTALGGRIIAPGAATVRSSLGGRTIDFGIIDARIEHAVEKVFVDDTLLSSPHQAVVFRFRNNATRQLVKQMIRPRCFGSENRSDAFRQPQQSSSTTRC